MMQDRLFTEDFKRGQSMIINVLEYLEQSQNQFSEKVLYRDEQNAVTFQDVFQTARIWGSFLIGCTSPRKPILVITDKTITTPELFFAVLYSGCFYVPIDLELPKYRLKLILDTVQADIMITAEEHRQEAETLEFSGKIISTADMEGTQEDTEKLDAVRRQVMDVDPAYVIFTSGSTGIPKGVVESHRQLIDYIEAFSETFAINEEDIFGNQSPLDYVAALRDLYLPLKTGASTVLIPKKYFSMPVRLFQYLNENKVTTICWVTGALTLCSELGVFEEIHPEFINKVFFTGSVMPCKHLRVWQENLPSAVFVNHYGPTEITASCTWYMVDHLVSEEEELPIGQPFCNTRILLITEDGREAAEGETGEIYVQGTSLALGYYRNPEKTREVFVKNPLNPIYDEIVYRTGDIGKVDHQGNLLFCGRKDDQIKHMGHRVELGEIQAAAVLMPEIYEAVCLYKKEKQQIWLFYTGEETSSRDISRFLKERLPNFMIPRKFIYLEEMPLNFNGKINMNELREKMK